MTEDNLFIEDIDWTLIDPEKFEKIFHIRFLIRRFIRLILNRNI